MAADRAFLRAMWAAALIGALTFVGGCASKEEKIASFVAKGDQLLAAGDPVSANLEYRNALQLDPRNLAAMLRVGKAFLMQNEHLRAYGAFKSALEVEPGCGEARVQAAMLLAMGNEGEMALEELKQLKDPAAFQPTVDITRARALISLQRYPEAVEILTGIPGATSNKEVQMLLAFTYRTQKRYDLMEQAVALWRQADPADPASYLFLAQHAVEGGMKDEAVRELDQLVAADPADTKRPLLKAQCLERLGLIPEAEAAYETLGEGNDALSAKADFWMRTGALPKARAALQALIASDVRDADAAIKLAQVYTDLEQPNLASDLLKRVLEENLKKSERERVLIAKAKLCAGQNDWETAVDLCKGILKENQADMDAHLLLGKILLRTHDAAGAEVHLSQAAASRPEDADAQILLARSQLLSGKDAMAGDTLRRALETNPKNASLRAELIQYHCSRNELDQALKVADKGLALNPKDPEPLRSRGEIHRARQEWDLAQKDFASLIAVEPGSPIGYLETGNTLMAQSRVDEAVAAFKKAAEQKDGWKVATPALVAAYIKQGDAAAALAVARREVEKEPRSALAQFYLGQAFELAGKLAESEQAFLKAVELSPDWPSPSYELTRVYLKQNKLAEAIERLERESGTKASRATSTQLAMLYEQAGRYDDAIHAYEELLEKDKTSPDLLNNLAYLYAEYLTDRKKLAEAAEFAARALDRQPNNPSFLDTSAWVAFKQGDLDAAWAYSKNAHRNGPNGPSEAGVHDLHAAFILEARGKLEEALTYLNSALGKWLGQRDHEKALALKQELEKKTSPPPQQADRAAPPARRSRPFTPRPDRDG